MTAFAFSYDPVSFPAWATLRGIPGAGMRDDGDGDGLKNSVEYALGTDPAVSNDPPAPSLVMTNGAAAAEIVLPGFPLGVRMPLLVEASTTVGDWGQVPASNIVPALSNPIPAGEVRTQTVVFPEGGTAGRCFVRLVVVE
jgi:hypothetical protein